MHGQAQPQRQSRNPTKERAIQVSANTSLTYKEDGHDGYLLNDDRRGLGHAPKLVLLYIRCRRQLHSNTLEKWKATGTASDSASDPVIPDTNQPARPTLTNHLSQEMPRTFRPRGYQDTAGARSTLFANEHQASHPGCGTQRAKEPPFPRAIHKAKNGGCLTKVPPGVHSNASAFVLANAGTTVTGGSPDMSLPLMMS